ncbi:MAG: CHAD domain-containing protein, partial [Hyphomicrobiales bacterium]
MAFTFKPAGNIGKEITRLGSEQIADAIGRLTGDGDLRSGVHEARKCLKRSRAVLALSQPAMPGKRFQRADKRLRKIARNLARARDAHAMMETVEKLDGPSGRLPAADILRSEIGARVADVNRRLDGDTLSKIVDRLKKAQDRFARLKLKI